MGSSDTCYQMVSNTTFGVSDLEIMISGLMDSVIPTNSISPNGQYLLLDQVPQIPKYTPFEHLSGGLGVWDIGGLKGDLGHWRVFRRVLSGSSLCSKWTI